MKHMMKQGMLMKTASLLLSFSFVLCLSACFGKAEAKYMKETDAILYNGKSYKQIPNDRWWYSYAERDPIRCKSASGNPFSSYLTLYFLQDDPNELFLVDRNQGFYDLLYMSEEISLSDVDFEKPDQLKIQFDYYNYKEIIVSDPEEIKTISNLLDNPAAFVDHISKKYFPDNKLTTGGLTVWFCRNDFPLQYKGKRMELSDIL